MGQRKWYIDRLRVVSIAAVVVIHTAAQYWGSLDAASYEWWVANVFDGLTRWAVPVFVMISGALFLDDNRETSIRALYAKNILKIVILILFWGFVYAALYSPPDSLSLADIKSFAKDWLFGHYHMWFLYMIAGLYALVPILRCITRSEVVLNYFLALGFALNSVVPFLASFGPLSDLTTFFAKISIQMPVGFSFYFVLGYKLAKTDFSSRDARLVYILGIIGGIATVLLTGWASLVASAPTQTYYSYFMPPVALTAVAVFVFAERRDRVPRSSNSKKRLLALSKASLGVYMVHIMVLDTLLRCGIDSMCVNPIIAIPATAGIAIIVSFVISLLLGKIPLVGKYFV